MNEEMLSPELQALKMILDMVSGATYGAIAIAVLYLVSQFGFVFVVSYYSYKAIQAASRVIADIQRYKTDAVTRKHEVTKDVEIGSMLITHDGTYDKFVRTINDFRVGVGRLENSKNIVPSHSSYLHKQHVDMISEALKDYLEKLKRQETK